MKLSLFFNIVAACGTAIFTGVMLNIGLSFGAYWKTLSPSEFLDWFGMNSNLIGRTIPVFIIPPLIGIVMSFYLSNGKARYYWLASLTCFLGIIAITFVYHLPTNALFISRNVPLEQVSGMLNQWLNLHTVRILLGLSSSVLSIIAIQQR